MKNQEDFKLVNVGKACDGCENVEPIPTLLSHVRCRRCGKILELSPGYRKYIASYYSRLGILDRQMSYLTEK